MNLHYHPFHLPPATRIQILTCLILHAAKLKGEEEEWEGAAEKREVEREIQSSQVKLKTKMKVKWKKWKEREHQLVHKSR